MMFRFCVFFLCLTIVTSSKQWRSGYRFFNDIDGWLKLNPIPATWDVARMRCQSEGAELASPVDNEMLEAMVMILNKNSNHCGVFTGYHDIYTDGYFHSISGVPITSSPAKWYGKREKCSDQHGDAFILRPDGTLDTAKKTDAYPFFCYKKYENGSSSYNGECGTTDRGYGFAKATGSCYKFHNKSRTWHEAARICSEEGGQLAIVNSKEEAQVLRDLFKKYPQSVMDSRFKEAALVGFLDWGTNGGWLTIHGQTLNAAGYDSWSLCQPDHTPHPDGTPVNGTTFCGAIFRSALLDDVWCDVKFAFICEKTPAMIDDETQPNNQDRNQCQCQQR